MNSAQQGILNPLIRKSLTESKYVFAFPNIPLSTDILQVIEIQIQRKH